jgi:hypothetical protein
MLLIRRGPARALLLAFLAWLGLSGPALANTEQTGIVASEVAGTEGGLVFRGKAQFVNAAGKCYVLSCQFRYEKPPRPSVKRCNGLDYRYELASVIVPEGPRHVRDVEIKLTGALLARDAELAVGTHLIRAYWAILDEACRAYVGTESGWDNGVVLVVEKATNGKVRIFPFAPKAFDARDDHKSDKISVLEGKLRVKHLVRKPGTSLVLAFGAHGDQLAYLRLPPRSAQIESLNRGLFFGPIDSPDKAIELVKLGHGGGGVIKTREQYDALRKALVAHGWKAPQVAASPPPAYGVSARAVGELGYLVDLLVLTYEPQGETFGDVVYETWAVTRDGRLGVVATPYLRAPEKDQPLRRRAYTMLVFAALTKEGAEEILDPFSVRKRRTIRIPSPEGLPARSFRSPR